MTATRARLLAELADGGLHSGTELAHRLGVSRAAIAKHVARLRGQGWSVAARRGGGYCLPAPERPLRREILETALTPCAARLDSLAILAEVDSTSAWLERRAAPPAGRTALCIAEAQTAGRGRRGRSWHSSAGRSITFSAARSFQRAPAELGALGLAVGVALAELLHDRGADTVGLKWPNDIVSGEAKLGGILIEVRGEAAGAARATVGVGLNHGRASPGARGEDPATAPPLDDVALADLLDPLPPRDRLAGEAMAAVIEALDRFEREGMAPLHSRWNRLDRLAGRPVSVWTGADRVDGHARGIAADGALLFDDASGARRRLYSGDVSLRKRA